VSNKVGRVMTSAESVSSKESNRTGGNGGEGGTPAPTLNFLRMRIAEDKASGRFDGRVQTRFPPEPNGYLHIGHAKSICLNFGLAAENGGVCNLRFDDTNPETEEEEYVEGMKRDIRWLGFDWGDHIYHASDYFEPLHDYAIQLIEKGKAYVCSLSEDEIRTYRGTVTKPGRNSPYRDRSVKENLDLFRRMKEGEFEDGVHVLRAKIDMASTNMKMRDPLLYRIRNEHHYRTGDRWHIYPMYDFAHGLSDSLEGVTHSICTLEFENNRELYDWILDRLDVFHPQQIEFARLNLSRTVMSKRLLLEFVKEGIVSGWDDPRMPTLSGLRRRGFTPESIRSFCESIGVAKRDSIIELTVLENHLRQDLNMRAPRVMAVLDPLKVIIDNYPEDQVEEFDAINNPEDESAGSRKVPFSRVVYIERDDFREEPPKKFFRLGPGREVRLKNAYFITCDRVVKDEATGEILELHCTYDPESRGGDAPDGRKVRGTLHWVSEKHALEAEVRLFEPLLTVTSLDEIPGDKTFRDYLNPDSRKILSKVKIEPSLTNAAPGDVFQFLRHGYFVVDPDSKPGKIVFNRAVSLRDSWARIEKTKPSS